MCIVQLLCIGYNLSFFGGFLFEFRSLYEFVCNVLTCDDVHVRQKCEKFGGFGGVFHGWVISEKVIAKLFSSFRFKVDSSCRQ